MTRWHPLDGNMIAADSHYEQSRPSDFDECGMCGVSFVLPDVDGFQHRQDHDIYFLCESCADEMKEEYYEQGL